METRRENEALDQWASFSGLPTDKDVGSVLYRQHDMNVTSTSHSAIGSSKVRRFPVQLLVPAVSLGSRSEWQASQDNAFSILMNRSQLKRSLSSTSPSGAAGATLNSQRAGKRVRSADNSSGVPSTMLPEQPAPKKLVQVYQLSYSITSIPVEFRAACSLLQVYLDVGQKGLETRMCDDCGLTYTPGLDSDEKVT